MSRIAKEPVVVPSNVEISLTATEVSVKGPLGKLQRDISSDIAVKHEGDVLLIKGTNNSR